MSDTTLQREDETEQSVAPAGKFRVYLGAAAGVGKTCAMLDEGTRRHERGRDVVIGFAESHGRPYTEKQIGTLEVIPRKLVEYHGTTFEEMDLAAILERHPEVALVDELAHTNVPGSGAHEKRWQDVMELLEAGISVVSTVNVQHLESIADAVESITGARVRERVPDWVVRKADQLELIDSSPEQLRRRMLHGNIYPKDKVPAALSGFFRTENLVALRELVLRFVADETEEELLTFLERHHQDSIWDTSERIVVAINGSEGTEAMMHRAARLAARSKAELHVIYVANSDQPRNKVELQALEQLSNDLGATWTEIYGDDTAAAIVDYAALHQVTQIVIGSSSHSRITSMRRGSTVAKVLRHAREKGIDVHVIARVAPKNLSDKEAAD